MAFYSLLHVGTQETTGGVVARNRTEAVAVFGRQLGLDLAVEDNDGRVADFLLDEWWEQPHWVNHTIPVYSKLKGR
ncbi:MAG: hypothetical protein KGL02_06665 [Acidobacteriota bacterium]|nr:hypothetical protein [Acidobacteriota bacterium]